MAKARLIYLPLGGAGEIGMNLYVYGYGPKGRENLIVVEAGIAFPNYLSPPGIDFVMPDISWLKKRAKRVKGIFLTHAHEDHVGAIVQLVEHIDAPVYARRFTSLLIQQKFEEVGFSPSYINCLDVEPHLVEVDGFKISFIPVTHSIPESSALLIESPIGRIVHTGDFRIDGNPMIGSPFDYKVWQKIGNDGVNVLVCDSTNVFVNRKGRSESVINQSLVNLFSETKGLVAATTFASNVARVRQIAEAGYNAGRSIVLLGRAMVKMTTVAQESGVITDFPPTISPEEGRRLPREKLLLLTTGSQGEPRSATTQLSYGKFRGYKLVSGDTLLYSSKTIPGNELSVSGAINRFASNGVKVIEDNNQIYHVSGHANEPELTELQHMLKPDLVVPMHGEIRHLFEHAELANRNGYNSKVVTNGQMLDLIDGEINFVDENVGKLFFDRKGFHPENAPHFRDRWKMAREGVVIVVVLESRSHEFSVAIDTIGFELNNTADLEDYIKKAINGHSALEDFDDEISEFFEENLVRLVSKAISGEYGRKPIIRVFFVGNES